MKERTGMGKGSLAAAHALAATQYGAIAWRQARDLGMSDTAIRTCLRNGVWLRAGHGVYVVAGSPATFERSVMVAILGEVDGAAASHLAAGYLLGVVTTRPARVDVTVPHGSHDGRRPESPLVHVARSFGPSDVRSVRGIRVMCPARTLVDLAGVLDRDRLAHALDRSLIEGLLTIAVLERYILDRHLRCLKGVGVLSRLIADRKAFGPHGSGVERSFRRICDERGIPRARSQFEIGDATVDFVYTEFKIAIEIDHVWTHGTALRLRSDLSRQNRIGLDDYLILRFTDDDLTEEPDRVGDEVERALRRRGWSPS